MTNRPFARSVDGEGDAVVFEVPFEGEWTGTGVDDLLCDELEGIGAGYEGTEFVRATCWASEDESDGLRDQLYLQIALDLGDAGPAYTAPHLQEEYQGDIRPGQVKLAS